MSTINSNPIPTKTNWVNDAADAVLAGTKGADGKLKVLDIVPDAVDFASGMFGVSPLPQVDRELAAQSTETLLLMLSSQTDAVKLAKLKSLAESALPRLLGQAAVEVAAKALAGDDLAQKLGAGLIGWVVQNPDKTFDLGAKVVATIAAAIASGGTSLAKDLPSLAVTLVSTAAGVLDVAGIKPEKLVSQVAGDLLKFIGVADADAQKIAKVVGPLAVLGADIALAIASSGKHPIRLELVENAAKEIAGAVGVKPDTAAVVAAAAVTAFTLGQNVAGFVLGGGKLEEYGGLGKLGTDVGAVAKQAVKSFLEGTLQADSATIATKLLALQPLIQSFIDQVAKDATEVNKTQTKAGFAEINKLIKQWLPDLAPTLDAFQTLA